MPRRRVRIRVKNSGADGAKVKLSIDGKPLPGNLVPYATPVKTVVVDCEV